MEPTAAQAVLDALTKHGFEFAEFAQGEDSTILANYNGENIAVKVESF